MSERRIDVSDAVSEMAGEDDPSQVARILDNELANIGYRVVSGYNENHGYYLIEE